MASSFPLYACYQSDKPVQKNEYGGLDGLGKAGFEHPYI
jgi:hypothetical protein